MILNCFCPGSCFALISCGGLNRYDPHRLVCLNPIGSDTLEGVALLQLV